LPGHYFVTASVIRHSGLCTVYLGRYINSFSNVATVGTCPQPQSGRIM